MVGKKGYMRTLEAMIALVLTFSFLLYVFPSANNRVSESSQEILISLINEQEFRYGAMNLSSCISKGDNLTLNSLLDISVLQNAEYKLCPQNDFPILPRKKVNVESIFLTGNLTNYTNKKIIRLYYWE